MQGPSSSEQGASSECMGPKGWRGRGTIDGPESPKSGRGHPLFTQGWAAVSPSQRVKPSLRALCGLAAHLLLHVCNLTADPLDEPVQFQHLVLGVFEVIPMPAGRQLQLLDLVSRDRKLVMRQDSPAPISPTTQGRESVLSKPFHTGASQGR